jgi:hypothetical protein
MWKLSGDAVFRMDYCDGTQFWIDQKRENIWARWSEKSSFEDTVSYLLGPVLGFVLRMRGVTCLHASAVACDGEAIAFVGPPVAGKSTTAAAMLERGHAVVSDDVVALTERDGRFYVAPAYPYLSLWPECVEALYGPDKSLSAFSKNYQKRRVPLRGGTFASEPVPLRRIFLLEERTADAGAPYIGEIATREALISLVTNTYANLLLSSEMRAKEFACLGRLVNAVPVRKLRAHRDAARIGALCELIEDDLSTLSTGVGASCVR